MATERICTTPTPPSWAEALLRVFLTPADFDSVSGDLLEEYRDSIRAVRGESAAGAWYVMQVLGFERRSARIWAVLFAVAFVTRTALTGLRCRSIFTPDRPFQPFWYRPPAVGGTLGIHALWFILRGTLAGVAASSARRRDQRYRRRGPFGDLARRQYDGRIRASGGLGEVFELPVMMVIPGAVPGTIGGVVGATIKRLRSA